MRLKILLVNRFYWPDESATAMLATDIAEGLAAAGHGVTVLTSAVFYNRFGRPSVRRESRRGVEIRRCWSPDLGRDAAWKRVVDGAVFHLGVRWPGGLAGAPDVVLSMTDPPLLAVSVAALCRRLGAALVLFSADIYPDLAVALGVVPERSPVVRALTALARDALRRCDHVLALGPRMRERLVAAGVAPDRVSVVPPWAVLGRAHERDRVCQRFRRDLGLGDDDCLVMYAGNLGRCHPWETLLAGMVGLSGDDQPHWVYVGAGSHRRCLEEACDRVQPARVRFLPYQKREDLDGVLAAADVHLITQDPRTVGLCVPSKLASVLAAGRAVVFVGPATAEVAETVRRHDCGLVVEEGDDEALVEAVRRLAASPELRVAMGERARRAFTLEAAPERALERIRQTLEAVARRGSAGGPGEPSPDAG